MPHAARLLRLDHPITPEAARDARKAIRACAVFAVSGREVAAFGTDDDLEQIFGAWGVKLQGERVLDPAADSWALGLMYEALAKSLTRRRPLWPMLRMRGHSLVVARTSSKLDAETQRRYREMLKPLRQAYGGELIGSVPGSGLDFAEAIKIRLEVHDGQWWCVFNPFTW